MLKKKKEFLYSDCYKVYYIYSYKKGVCLLFCVQKRYKFIFVDQKMKSFLMLVDGLWSLGKEFIQEKEKIYLGMHIFVLVQEYNNS